MTFGSPTYASLPQRPAGDFLDPDKTVMGYGLTSGMNVADFGCGSGHFTVAMAGLVGDPGRVYAVDVQEQVLDSVRAQARAKGLKNLETIHADLEVLGSSGLGDSTQDVVTIHNVLFQSKKKEAILTEARRVLKPGGRLVVIDWAKGSGGFGPPDQLRTDDISMQSLVGGVGFLLDRRFEAGQFHFGLMFKKSV